MLAKIKKQGHKLAFEKKRYNETTDFLVVDVYLFHHE